MDMLTLSNVSKSFGSVSVLEDLSFSVPANTVYGFIGQNGAGKTTTMKMILGLLRADRGTIAVNGETVRYGKAKTNRFIGYLPDVPEFYTYMSPLEYLVLCGRITGMEEPDIRKRSAELLELVGLPDKAQKRIQGFSRGMKQRLGIAQALLNSPSLLICDEPTSALDPIGRKEILDILSAVKERTTVIFSTHILSDVERICDEIGLLSRGKLAFQGTIEEIRKKHGNGGFEVEFYQQEEAARFAQLLPGGGSTGTTQLFYEKESGRTMRQAIKVLNDAGICPVRLERKEPTLESLFLEVVGK